MASTDFFPRQDLGQFDGDKLRERIEQAHLLVGLTEHPGWQVLEAIVGGHLAAEERAILAGRLDPDVYRNRSGYVRGLREVLETPAEFNRIVAREQETAPS